jgi:uracil-DNA glycosylase family 4
MPRLVPDEGTGRERLVVIGEAPGRWEEAQGRPFVGPSGRLLADWQRAAGVARTDCYWTNVVPYRPRTIEALSKDEIAAWTAKLHERLAALTDPYILVPTGTIALRAVTGLTSITKYRGSLLVYGPSAVKVCPTIHPAAILRDPAAAPLCRADWRRIAEEAKTRELVLPHREHQIRPTRDDLTDLLVEATRADCLAIDIETPRERTYVAGKRKGAKKQVLGDPRVACVGVAVSATRSLTIPTTWSYWQSTNALGAAWSVIRALANLPVPKAMQNGLFDAWWLSGGGRVGGRGGGGGGGDGGWLGGGGGGGVGWGVGPGGLRAWRWDPMCLHHVLDPVGAHDLATMASVDTREPYWKDDTKAAADLPAEAPDDALDAFWRYNGKDCCVTWELADLYARRVEAAGQTPFYFRHYVAMWAPLLRMMLDGVAVDDARRQERLTAVAARIRETRAALAALAGEPLTGPKGAPSPQRIARFLYERLRLPKQTAKGAAGRTATTNEIALRRLALRYPTVAGAPCGMLLDLRRQSKLGTFLSEGAADGDGRVRTTYRFTTTTGRLASGKAPNRRGMNLQNVDRETRDLFVADAGQVLVEVDLSQAESRVVYVLTGDPELIRLARTPPWVFDVHRRNAGIIFRVAESQVTADQRYLGKRAVHASHYGMRGGKLSEVLLLDGVVETPEACDRMIEAYLAAHPAIVEWQRRVRRRLLEEHCLTTTWGRLLDFGELAAAKRLDDEAFRQGYAFQPQSEVADLLNQYGLIPFSRVAEGFGAALRLQVHDALVVSCPPALAWAVAEWLRGSLERPRRYGGVELTIPVDVKIGRTWGTMRAFGRPPTRREFEQAATEALAA